MNKQEILKKLEEVKKMTSEIKTELVRLSEGINADTNVALWEIDQAIFQTKKDKCLTAVNDADAAINRIGRIAKDIENYKVLAESCFNAITDLRKELMDSGLNGWSE